MQKEHRAEDDERNRHLLFVRVQPGRDEEPELIEDERQRDHQPAERADLHRQHEGLEALRVHEFRAVDGVQLAEEREPDEGLDAVDEEERDHAADDEAVDARDQPLPELVEMVQKRHLRAGVLEGVRIGQMDVSIVVVGNRCGPAGEGNERHGAGYTSPG